MADDKTPKEETNVPEEKTSSIRDFLQSYGKTEQTAAAAETKTDTTKTKDKTEAVAETSEKTDATKAQLTEKDVEEQVAKAKKEVLDKIMVSFGLDSKEEDTTTEADYVTPWKREGRKNPKDYDEIVEAAAEKAQIDAQKRQAAEKRLADEQQRARTEQDQKLNQVWDDQLSDLREQGKIPKIAPQIEEKLKKGLVLTDDDRKDEGLKAQNELFQTMYAVSNQRISDEKPAVTNLKEVYYEHYADKKNQPAGSEAPVSGGSRKAEVESDTYKYQDINKQSYYDILRNG